MHSSIQRAILKKREAKCNLRDINLINHLLKKTTSSNITYLFLNSYKFVNLPNMINRVIPRTQSLNKVMSLRNLLLMQILRNRKKLPLTEIVKDFRKLGMSKPPTKTSIYANLQKLATQNQVEITWEKNNKFYRLSTSGLNELAEIESLLKVGK